ncbi:hypothetical protein [Bartonella sp. F02]|uniref:hypothetical protein n=1 Tax=Bartonella sp. F02 TaxID=2967262 RepID=UPI0022A97DE7|nr:hypothetical protein [Bartonella sp. F02]MCZ2327934.1 hypothetical protein [Bartonella sp. F02]
MVLTSLRLRLYLKLFFAVTGHNSFHFAPPMMAKGHDAVIGRCGVPLPTTTIFLFKKYDKVSIKSL